MLLIIGEQKKMNRYTHLLHEFCSIFVPLPRCSSAYVSQCTENWTKKWLNKMQVKKRSTRTNGMSMGCHCKHLYMYNWYWNIQSRIKLLYSIECNAIDSAVDIVVNVLWDSAAYGCDRTYLIIIVIDCRRIAFMIRKHLFNKQHTKQTNKQIDFME